jgi:DNA-binding CsgD family transcriptional regulator
MTQGLRTLTERERQTLRLLLDGHDIKSIAGRLDLSVHTVNERLREARRKLGVSSSRQAARLLAEQEQTGPHFSADKQSGVVAPAGRADDPPRQARGRGRSLIWLGGGLLIMISILAAVVLSSTLQTAAQPAPPTAGAPDPVAARSAQTWVELLDKQRWDESFKAAGAEFRAKITAANWSSMIQPLRQQVGPVVARAVQTANRTAYLPGQPNGDYEVIQFATNFQLKGPSVETVVLTHEASGWKVNGYFIR